MNSRSMSLTNTFARKRDSRAGPYPEEPHPKVYLEVRQEGACQDEPSKHPWKSRLAPARNYEHIPELGNRIPGAPRGCELHFPIPESPQLPLQITPPKPSPHQSPYMPLRTSPQTFCHRGPTGSNSRLDCLRHESWQGKPENMSSSCWHGRAKMRVPCAGTYQ